MKKLFGILVASLTMVALPISANALHAEGGDTITHTYGGEGGEWETDANTEGVWSYYATPTTEIANRVDCTIWEDQNGYGCPDEWFQIAKSGFMHPGGSPNNSSPTLGYKAEKAGCVSFTFSATRDSDSASTMFNNSNNGTMAYFYLNNSNNELGTLDVVQTANTITINDVYVSAGDEIFAMVYSKGDTAYDGATYKFEITLDTTKTNPNLITHKYGGTDGEWETDANTEGVWNYYATPTTDLANRVNCTIWEDQNGYGCPDEWFQIAKSGFMHPGGSPNNSSPTLGYVAEKAGCVSLTLKAARDGDDCGDTNIGDIWNNGTLAYFYLNDTNNQLGALDVVKKSNTVTINDVYVKAGDEIFVMVSSKGNTACDGATYELTISLEAGKKNPNIIDHKFGGTDGEWETDANTEGVWNYYATPTTDLANRVNCTIWEDQNGYGCPDEWFQIAKSGFMHPGGSPNNSSPTLGYVAEKAGCVSLTLKAARDGDDCGDTDIGDIWNNGTLAYFYLKNANNELGKLDCVKKSNTVTINDVYVKAGDEIFVMVSSKGNTACDGATYELSITLEVGKKDPNVIEHRYGGLNGEWETDANTEGVWNYYGAPNKDLTQLIDGTQKGDGSGVEVADAWFQLNRNGYMHPGAEPNYSSPTVGYVVEKDGTLTITINASRDSNADNTEIGDYWNNGTMVLVFKNNNETELGRLDVVQTSNTVTIDDVAVKAGDEIFVMVWSKDSTSCDSASYEIIHELKVEEQGGGDPEGGDSSSSSESSPISSSSESSSSSEPEPSSSSSETYTPVHPTDPTEPALEGDLESVNNIDDFRYSQGAKGFTYMYGAVADGISGLLPLTATNAKWDTVDVVPYLAIRMDGLMHPGYTDQGYMVALGWTTEVARVVDIHLDAIFEEVEENYGDGVTIGIYKNTDLLLDFDMTAKDNLYNNNDPIVAEIHRLSLEANDTLYFTVSPNANNGWDGVLTYIEISWVKEKATSSSSSESKPAESSSKPAESSSKPADSSSNTTPTSSNSSAETPTKTGCGGTIVAASVLAFTGSIAAALILKSKKKKED